MWTFLGSECLFFGSLIATYLVFRNQSLVGPYPEEIIDVPITSVSTFVLLMSSLAMVLALNAIQRDRKIPGRFWILGTAALGSGFLGFQVFEFNEFVHKGLTPRTNLFGTTFFTLTGFHGAHVTVGVLWLLAMAFVVSPGRSERWGLGLAVAGFYAIMVSILAGVLDIVGLDIIGPLEGWPAPVIGVFGALALVYGGWILARAGRGATVSDNALSLEIAGLYWHFVDIVWIVIFTVVYLVSALDGPLAG